MPCRVGITTRPTERKAEWQLAVDGFRNWSIIAKYPDKQKAQEYENRYAKQHGCKAEPGGADALGTWYVYRFDYTRDRR